MELFKLKNMNGQLLQLEFSVEKTAYQFPFIFDLQQRRRLFISGQLVSPAAMINFRNLMKTVTDFFPAEYWDFEFTISDDFPDFRMDIKALRFHFPEFIIKNSRGAIHTIKDLFVKINLVNNNNLIELRSLSGTRLTFTQYERNAEYGHSHLPRFREAFFRTAQGYGSMFNNFCTGSGPINNVKTTASQTNTISDFTKFFLHLTKYIVWESLEGSPYVRMSNIVSATSSLGISRMPSQADITSFIRRTMGILKVSTRENNFTPANFPINISFDNTNNQFIVNVNNAFNDFFKNLLNDREKHSFIVNQAGQHYGGTDAMSVEPYDSNTKIVFRGVEKRLTVTSDATIQTSDLSLFHLKPEITITLKNFLEDVLNTTTNTYLTNIRYKN